MAAALAIAAVGFAREPDPIAVIPFRVTGKIALHDATRQ
jgi:hypothetical protein